MLSPDSSGRLGESRGGGGRRKQRKSRYTDLQKDDDDWAAEEEDVVVPSPVPEKKDKPAGGKSTKGKYGR